MLFDYPTKKRFVLFLQRAEPATELIGLGLIIGFFFALLPIDVLSKLPASGGDMGSHFWPVHTLFEYGLPNGQVRVWNPGNLGGEPHLLHYFPLPFLLMAFLGFLLPLGTAFNIGTLIPVLMLPVCAYLCMKGLKVRYPGPLFGACGSFIFLYNESYTMWGGNVLSTLAGQFAHLYALNFLLLGLGALAAEFRRNSPPFLSQLMFAGVCLSHAYVYVGVPLFLLSFVLFSSKQNLKARLIKCFWSGFGSLVLSVWYFIPMLDNARWTTTFSIIWRSGDKFFGEILPEQFWPVVAILIMVTVVLQLLRGKQFKREIYSVAFWFLPTIGYSVYYFLFPLAGLVDVRAIPQAQLFSCILAGTLLGILFRCLPRVFTWTAAIPVVICAVWWTDLHAKKVEPWLEWNYSGWSSKHVYSDLSKLSSFLKGDYSMPRVVYEHNDRNNMSGSVRVFELIPYFMSRSTLEGLYLQATVLAPEAFYIQAKVSKTPSCPFSQYKCTGFDLETALPLLDLMGVGQLILVNEKIIASADEIEELEAQKAFGMWHVYKIKQPVSYAIVAEKEPFVLKETADYQRVFYDWFKDYTPESEFILIEPKDDKLTDALSISAGAAAPEGGCLPKVSVDFNKIVLRTNCPGKLHYLKFAYHPTWKANTGDAIFMASPGFLALVPSERKVELEFGHSKLWDICNSISAVGFFVFLVVFAARRRRNAGR